jgi:hypothetical protein
MLTVYYTLTITNGQINNCNCCQLNLNNTTPPGPWYYNKMIIRIFIR